MQLAWPFFLINRGFPGDSSSVCSIIAPSTILNSLIGYLTWVILTLRDSFLFDSSSLTLCSSLSSSSLLLLTREMLDYSDFRSSSILSRDVSFSVLRLRFLLRVLTTSFWTLGLLENNWDPDLLMDDFFWIGCSIFSTALIYLISNCGFKINYKWTLPFSGDSLNLIALPALCLTSIFNG
jgi:hypothetical protein